MENRQEKIMIIPKERRMYIVAAGAFLGAAISISKILLTAAPLAMIPGLNLLWSAIVTTAALAVVGGLLGYGLCKFFAKKEPNQTSPFVPRRLLLVEGIFTTQLISSEESAASKL